tara:strand:+ start:3453 stop:3593 length:141 start_codon:yes stop_codon:yes gene_type:complete
LNLPIIPQTKNPGQAGFDVAKREKLLKEYHFSGLNKTISLQRVKYF